LVDIPLVDKLIKPLETSTI